MKTHFGEKKKHITLTKCGKYARDQAGNEKKVSLEKDKVDCKVCLKIINKVHKPSKTWIEIKGSDQTWKIEGKDNNVDELITYLAGRFSDKIILEEMKKRGLKTEL